MGELDSYKQNCDYIRKTFSLPETASLYAHVNAITEAYKEQQELAEAKENLKKEKKDVGTKRKRGRPAKRNSN